MKSELELSVRARVLLLVLLALPGVGFAVEFSLDVLARAPVLDARENLAYGERIRAGELAEEPLYRALLYPWVLSMLPVETEHLGRAAVWLGLLFHFASAFLVASLAGRLWKCGRARWIAGGLYAVYPVALYFSAQVLDVVFATMLFLAGLVCLLRGALGKAADPDSAGAREGGRGWFIAAGIFAGLAILARPNFLPAALLFPLVAGGREVRQGGMKMGGALMAFLLAGLPMAGLLVGQGLVNQRISGEFRILPWQGTYNLYAANREGANGRFYKQRVDFPHAPAEQNTTRMEAEYLYRQAKGIGDGEELSISALNSYWRNRLLDAITEDPVRWLGLMGRKLVYLLHDWEQYNNLSYEYQKERFAFLRWNPFGWGVLLLGTACALFVGFNRMSRPAFVSLAAVACAYAAGVLLFFASARFRLPLAPIMAVFCGGSVFLVSNRFCERMPRVLLPLGAVLALVGAVGFGNWFSVRDRETFIQDEILLASASANAGEDARALQYAEAALSRDARRQGVRRIQVTSLFNLWLENRMRPVAEDYWRKLGEALDGLARNDASTLWIGGLYAWKERDRERAVGMWREAVERFGSRAAMSAKALHVVGEGDGLEPGEGEGRILRQLLLEEKAE